MRVYQQTEFDIRCEWNLQGVHALAPVSDVVIIIDVLSFSTATDIAISRGAKVIPCMWRGEKAATLAKEKNALLVSHKRSVDQVSLSPTSLQLLAKESRIVLPSLNGSALSVNTGNVPTFTACLRNAKAVAEAAMKIGKLIAVIPAGERWQNGTLRPCFEDLLGAGAVISHLKGSLSPEAFSAKTVFEALKTDLSQKLLSCSSGEELIDRNFKQDVLLAAQLNTSNTVPMLVDGIYQHVDL